VPQQDLLNRIVDRVNDFNRRIRDLEEKVRNLTARVNTLDDSLLDKTKDLSSDIQDLEGDIEEIRDRIANMEVDIKELNREKKKYVTEQQIDEIENYMDLMNPIQSNFATKKEVKEMVNESSGVSEKKIEQIVDRKIKSRETQPNNKRRSKTSSEEGKR
jgi:archaellum component FlaC